MEIKSYKDSTKIPEKYLKSLVKSEIECWGSKPFDEFMKCSDDSCSKMYSIEDVYGSIESYRNRKNNKEFNCTCGAEAKEYYKPEEIFSIIKEHFNNEVFVVLLLDEEEVEGFGILSKGKLKDVVYSYLDSRPGSWDKEDALNLLSNKFFGSSDSFNREAICSHQIYVSPGHRVGNISHEIVKKTFGLLEGYNGLPIVGETRYDSKFYPITRAMGYEDILHDDYGYVLQGYNNYSEVLQFLNTFESYTERAVVSKLIEFSREVKNVLFNNPQFLMQKSYINNS